MEIYSPQDGDYRFKHKVGETEIFFSVSKIGVGLLYIWIGGAEAELNDLSLASQMKLSEEQKDCSVVATSLMNSGLATSNSESLASIVAKRLKKMVLLSLNVTLPAPFHMQIVEQLVQQMKENPVAFE